MLYVFYLMSVFQKFYGLNRESASPEIVFFFTFTQTLPERLPIYIPPARYITLQITIMTKVFNRKDVFWPWRLTLSHKGL